MADFFSPAGTISPACMTTSFASSSHSTSLIRAGDDCSWVFDKIGTLYDTKNEWIESSNKRACENGFRLYVGEGRALKAKKPAGSSARLELACWKYRGKDESGKRTRAGGCRFKLKGREMLAPDGAVKWQLVGGIFTHTHDCEEGPLPTRTVSSAGGRKKRAVTVKSAERSQSPSSSANDASPPGAELAATSSFQLAKTDEASPAILDNMTLPRLEPQSAIYRDIPTPAAMPLWYPPPMPFPPQRAQSFDAYTPYTPYTPYQMSPANVQPAYHNPPNPSSYLLRAVHSAAHHQPTAPLYSPHILPRSMSWSVTEVEGASPAPHFAPSPLTTASSPVSIVDTPPSLVSTANTTPSSSVASVQALAASRQQIVEVLRKADAELEQYADVWLATGIDIDHVKSWDAGEAHRFVDVDLVSICPELGQRPWHKWLLHLCLANLKGADANPVVPHALPPVDIPPHHFGQQHSVQLVSPMVMSSGPTSGLHFDAHGFDATNAFLSTSAPAGSPTSFTFQ